MKKFLIRWATMSVAFLLFGTAIVGGACAAITLLPLYVAIPAIVVWLAFVVCLMCSEPVESTMNKLMQ